MLQGLINPAQGQNLKNLVLKKAFDKYIQYGLKPKEQNNFQPQNSNQNFGVQLGKLQKSLGRGDKFGKKSFLSAVDDV